MTYTPVLHRLAACAALALAYSTAGAAVTTYFGKEAQVVCPVNLMTPACQGDVDTEAKADALVVPGTVTAERAAFLAGLSSSKGEEFLFRGFDASNILEGIGAISGPGAGIDNLPMNTGNASQFLGRWNTTAKSAPYPTDPREHGWYQNPEELNSFMEIVLDLGSEQNAVGFYLTDYGDFGATAELFLDGVSAGPIGPVLNNTPGTPEAGSGGQVLFFGVYSSDFFQTIRIQFNQPVPAPGTCSDPPDLGDPDICFALADGVGLDGLVVGVQRQTTGTVPEPGSIALLGLGLLAVRGVRRKAR